MRRTTKALALLAASAITLTGCSTIEEELDIQLPSAQDVISDLTGDESPDPADAAAGAGSIDSGAASAALDQLTIAPESDADYDRERDYADRWAMVSTGCDVRNHILNRDLTDVVQTGKGCKVASGVLDDPYTGETIQFQAGEGTSDDVQIEHIVPVSEAHDSGAAEWTQAEREAFYNDDFNLIAVDGEANNDRGDADAGEAWRPPNAAYHCQYAAGQIEVKAKYGMSVDQAEHDALAAILSNC